IVRGSQFPRLKSQLQRTRCGWKELFHLEYIGLTVRIVENRDTSKFRDGLFEQLQPLAAKFYVKVCNAGDVAAGSSKAFNYACLDRIKPLAHHNDGNGLGRLHDRPHLLGTCGYDDDVNLETHQLGGKLGVPIKLTLRISVRNRNVLSFYVAKLAKTLPDSLDTGIGSWIERRKIPYAEDCLRLLRIGSHCKSNQCGCNEDCQPTNFLQFAPRFVRGIFSTDRAAEKSAIYGIIKTRF